MGLDIIKIRENLYGGGVSLFPSILVSPPGGTSPTPRLTIILALPRADEDLATILVVPDMDDNICKIAT